MEKFKTTKKLNYTFDHTKNKYITHQKSTLHMYMTTLKISGKQYNIQYNHRVGNRSIMDQENVRNRIRSPIFFKIVHVLRPVHQKNPRFPASFDARIRSASSLLELMPLPALALRA